jgi:SAM-dependent methyltransferase
MFQEQLNTRIYAGSRAAAFGFLPDRDRRWLRGKSLINIGCASGRETAEIWLKLDGQILITAVDAVPSMLELAERNFDSLIDTIAPGHPPVTPRNRPRFDLADAMRLPYADNTFDSMFWFLMLQWVADPAKAIREAVSVVRPGGLLFGGQPMRPLVSNYMDLVVRASRNSYGFFWPQDYTHWFNEAGADIELGPIGIFLARKRPAG